MACQNPALGDVREVVRAPRRELNSIQSIQLHSVYLHAHDTKARFRRSEDQRNEDRLATLIRLGPVVGRDSTGGPDIAPPDGDCLPALAPPGAIDTIRRQVCEHFHLAEMRDPELTVSTNRRAYVLPRQLAMYIARQLTGASLEEIGREFGDKHYSTVLYSINKIEAMRRADEALNRTITRLVNAVVTRA